MALIMSLGIVTVFAQPRRGMGQGNAPQGWNRAACIQQQLNLTEEQQETINNLCTEHQKSMVDYRNQLREKHARLRTLQTADNPDMNETNTAIDELSNIRNNMMKEQAAHRQDVRASLTEEQRVIFDSRAGHRMGRGYRQGGHKRGYGQGYGRGYRPCYFGPAQ